MRQSDRRNWTDETVRLEKLKDACDWLGEAMSKHSPSDRTSERAEHSRLLTSSNAAALRVTRENEIEDHIREDGDAVKLIESGG